MKGDMMKFLAVIVIAIVVEGITEYIKMMVPEISENTKVLLALTVFLGVGSALAFNADVFSALGITARVPYIGCCLTGVLCARGSNYVYDLIGKFTDDAKPPAPLFIPDNETEAEKGGDDSPNGVG